MYFFLTEAIRRRLIKELRDFWTLHPHFPDLVNNIQSKYSFEERPPYGIVVKTGNASKIHYTADNFMGTGISYVTLAKIPGYPGVSVEWAREDGLAIENNGGKFPSAAGVYYCEMTSDDEFFVDPLLDVRDERVTMTTNSEGTLQAIPYAGSLRVYRLPGGQLLKEGTDYAMGADQVTIFLAVPLLNGQSLSVDYRVPGQSTGPWKALQRTGLNKAIPGVVMVFGRRFKKGDRWAILVSEKREPAYLQYGGKWEMGVDIDIITRDVNVQPEIADSTGMFLWSILRPRLVVEGIEISDVAFSGETEEIFDENADDYFYNSALTLQVQADWFLFIPLVQRIASYNETLKSLPQSLSLAPFRDPFFEGSAKTFEMIK